jgi:hypothetical protein
MVFKYSSFIKFRNRWQDTDRAVITFIKTIILFKRGDNWAAFKFLGKTDLYPNI